MCWIVEPSPMMNFMQSVGADPALQAKFKEDPKGVMDTHEAAKDLSEEDKKVLMSDDHAAVLNAIAKKHA